MAAKKTNVKNEPVATGDRKAALETVISRIERDCGKGSIMRLGEVSNLNVEAVSTG
ncbi:MAG: DNA recombination/repair protein RecA, partial [Clostridia bacterium]|nr:DNA recombination/repair protein RecA [Clostridia bacterium]